MAGETEVVTAVDPEVKEAPAKVVEEANDHTPDPQTPPVVEKLPEPPHGEDGLGELRSMVEGLANSVTALTELVTKNTDESTQSIPWTARGGSGKKSWDEDAD